MEIVFDKSKKLIAILLVMLLAISFSVPTFAAGYTYISLDKKNVTITEGKQIKLNATVKNLSNKTVRWSSSNSKVATVNSNGIVKGIKSGKAIITAATYNNRVKATCTVTVVKKAQVNKTSFAQVAANLKSKIAADKQIRYGGYSFDFSKTTPMKANKVDCSSYVSYVLYTYGKNNKISEYEKNFKKNKACGGMKSWLENNKKLATKVGNLKNVAKNKNLKAGDILISSGHVEIYAKTQNGDLYVYNCGSNNAIRKAGATYGASNSSRGSYTVYRLKK